MFRSFLDALRLQLVSRLSYLHVKRIDKRACVVVSRSVRVSACRVMESFYLGGFVFRVLLRSSRGFSARGMPFEEQKCEFLFMNWYFSPEHFSLFKIAKTYCVASDHLSFFV